MTSLISIERQREIGIDSDRKIYVFFERKRKLCEMLGLGQMGVNCGEKFWEV